MSEIKDAFETGEHIMRSEGFETGMNNPFRSAIEQCLRVDALATLDAIAEIIDGYSKEVQAECLIYVGGAIYDTVLGDAAIERALSLAEHALKSDDAYVRDAASLLLCDIDGLDGIAMLDAAIEAEHWTMLKRNMQQVADYLKRQRGTANSSDEV